MNCQKKHSASRLGKIFYMARGSNLTGFSWRQRPLKVWLRRQSEVHSTTDMGRERAFAL